MKFDFGKTLAEGFNVLFRNKQVFVMSIVIAILNSVLVAWFFSLTLFTISSPLAIAQSFSSILISIVVLGIVYFFVMSVLAGGIILSTYYGGKRKLSEMLITSVYRLPRCILASILVNIIFFVGFLALIIPGYYLMIRLIYYIQSIFIEKAGVVESLKRSWKISKGNWWVTFALVFVIGLISGAVGYTIILGTMLKSIILIFITVFIQMFLSMWSITSLTLAFKQLTGKSKG